MKIKLIPTLILFLVFTIIASTVDASIFPFGKKRYKRAMISAKSEVKPQQVVRKIKSKPVIIENKTDLLLLQEVESQSSPEPIIAEAPQSPEIEVIPEPLEVKSIVSNIQKNQPSSKVQNPSAKTEVQLTKEIVFTAVKPSVSQVKEVKNTIKNSAANSNDMLLLQVILAILLPPVAVLIHENAVNIKFLISILLTLLFWIPGVVYALLVVFDKL